MQSLDSKQRAGDIQVQTVDDLTGALKSLLEGAFPRVAVEGEVVNCRRASSGHYYFSLKGRRATLPSVLFRGQANRLARPLQDGDQVVCTGGVEVYPPHGRYQLVVQWVRLGGEGRLLAELDALKRKLHSEGLFHPDRKRTLPMVPRRIGVITSPTGAAIRDIVRSIHSRFPAPILLAPAAVQGAAAPAQLLRALDQLARVEDVDVIVLGRGGGSLEDLWAFNNEQLVRAIAQCPVPVVSAVGHEIDTMLTDYVADVRAATPTSAGELVVPDLGDLSAYIAQLRTRAARSLRLTTRQAHTRLAHLRARIRDPRRLVRDRWQRLDDLQGRLARAMKYRQTRASEQLDAARRQLSLLHPGLRVARERQRLSALEGRLQRAWENRHKQALSELQNLVGRLKAYSPTGVLKRGYAIVRRQDDGFVLRSHTEIEAGASIDIQLGVGELQATVNQSSGSEAPS